MARSRRTQSRFGRFGRFGRSRLKHDQIWSGEQVAIDPDEASYWGTTRRPLPCLFFILPLLLIYELGLLGLAGSTRDAHRAGADAWIRHAFHLVGLTDQWFLPLLLVCVMIGWLALDRQSWRFSPLVLGGMLVESFLLAIVLIGLSNLVGLGFERLDGPILAAPRGVPTTTAASLLGFLGAGIYEETLFRFASIPLIYLILKSIHVPGLAACTVAITLSSLLFSLAHHAGAPGEEFTLFAFVFRWLAGVFFAYVFVTRGFGVAVGTHSAYDLLVIWCDIHL